MVLASNAVRAASPPLSCSAASRSVDRSRGTVGSDGDIVIIMTSHRTASHRIAPHRKEVPCCSCIFVGGDCRRNFYTTNLPETQNGLGKGVAVWRRREAQNW